MTRIAKFEWTITGLKVNLPSEDEIDDDEDYGKISDASELLLAANAASGPAERKRLKLAAWQALQPLQLDVNYFTGGLFKKQGLSLGRNTGVVEIALTEDNTEWAIDGDENGLTLSVTVRCVMLATRDLSDQVYQDWLSEHGWEWIGLAFVGDLYEGDNGTDIVFSCDQ